MMGAKYVSLIPCPADPSMSATTSSTPLTTFRSLGAFPDFRDVASPEWNGGNYSLLRTSAVNRKLTQTH
jgi:hypothetical protein